MNHASVPVPCSSDLRPLTSSCLLRACVHAKTSRASVNATRQLVLTACTDHYTTQEAYEVCDDIIDRIDTTTEDSFADCVDCYERCGDECGQEAAAFLCPDDTE